MPYTQTTRPIPSCLDQMPRFPLARTTIPTALLFDYPQPLLWRSVLRGVADQLEDLTERRRDDSS